MNQTLEQKQDEKARLHKRYRAGVRAEWKALYVAEPRLKVFRRELRDVTNLAVWLADHPLRTAPMETRRAALRLIDRHATRQRRYAGLAPLDDPLPPGTNIFIVARELLAIR